ncbi:LLM class flavin-dependent oxidoreductase [Auritidibacter sp. NML100628]|uniref:LLM class flavin-dependent oxidoreductase n=1 Tax=Auritidibacter sp. NML100628 TaxID=2170742 RepID=UPI000D73581D|nr:LLM class flavin-dependent oxidoreductase [Auritidibacter sp. NML100628]PXA77076.1 hypothetical protein DCC24_05650 [Auritidibacter sp. NML100628]
MKRKPLFLLNAQFLTTSRDWRTSGGQDSPFDVGTFIRQARKAEAADIDAVFEADFSGVNRAALRSGPPLRVFESFQMSALVAASTERIAVMPTISTMHAHPFDFARSLASLDRISQGRAWINIVSSFRSGTGLGLSHSVPRERRHEQTEEFVNVARRLWTSWPPEANEASARGFIRSELITDLDHHGEFYDQPGPIDMPPMSRDFPFTLEATSSLAGVRLAARTADAIFAGTPTLGAAQQLRAIMRTEAENAGRSADDLLLLPGMFVNVTGSAAEADAIVAADRQRIELFARSSNGISQLQATYPGLHLDGLSSSDPVSPTILPADPSSVLAEHGTRYLPLWDLAQRPGQTLGEFAADAFSLGEHARMIGTAEQIANEIVKWYREDGVDGFQFILGNDFDSLCEQILPAIRAATDD